MLITILGAVAVIIVLVLIAASMRPDTFRIERSTTIDAPAEKIFPHINDFHAWGAWSPWEKLDPDMKRTFAGPDTGKGARYAWEGVPKVGRGGMEILESTPWSRIIIKLDFLKPFEAHNTADFALSPEGAGKTRVVWAMYGPQPFMNKVISLFMNMDKLVGPDFEKGLAALKSIAEK